MGKVFFDDLAAGDRHGLVYQGQFSRVGIEIGLDPCVEFGAGQCFVDDKETPMVLGEIIACNHLIKG